MGAGVRTENRPDCYSQIPTPKCQWVQISSRCGLKDSTLAIGPDAISVSTTRRYNREPGFHPNAEGSIRRRTSSPFKYDEHRIFKIGCAGVDQEDGSSFGIHCKHQLCLSDAYRYTEHNTIYLCDRRPKPGQYSSR